MVPAARSKGGAGQPSRPLFLTLVLWTVPALVFLLAVGLWLTTLTIRDLSDSAYDRSLAGAIRAIDVNISTESGGVGIELPYPLFESFEATADGEVYFRVSTDDGLVQIGEGLLPTPPPFDVGEILFFDETFFGRPIRVGAHKRPLDRALYGAPEAQNILIEVAETTGSREAFRNNLLRRAIWRDGLAIFVAMLFLALGARFALRPLSALGERLAYREADDRTAIEAPGVPREVRPLVDAVNGLLSRYRAQGEAQRRFIDDASHQLKTPIAVLLSQIDYALRADDAATQREALQAMRPILDRAARMTAQLLALARAKNAALLAPEARSAVPVGKLLGDVARLHLAQARARQIALEIDASATEAEAFCSEMLVFEALSNLVDNAIRHSRHGASVLLRSRIHPGTSTIVIEILDDGPGMDGERRIEVGERFRPSRTRMEADIVGSGLGLPIALSIVESQGGTLVLANRDPVGLAVTIHLPATEKILR